jgi:hypothetical protein
MKGAIKVSITRRLGEASKMLDLYFQPAPKSFRRIIILLDILMMRIFFGFRVYDYCCYEFHRLKLSARKAFLGERNGLKKIAHLLNDADDIIKFNNKLVFNKVFDKYLHRDWLSMNECTFDEFCDFCAAHSGYIKKPLDKLGGVGIEKHTVFGDSNLPGLYNKLKGENCLIEEIIIQDPEVASFNPGSVNTCRLYSVLNKSKVIIVDAYLRLGVGDVIVDNRTQGGLCAKIDVDTGVIITPGKDKMRHPFILHPATDKQIIGFEIPRWEEIKKTIEEAALVVPSVRYVGWDVAINSKGEICIIEGNHNGSFNLQEAIDLKGKKAIYENLLQDMK